MEQVSLAQAHAGVEEKGIIVLAGSLRHRLGGTEGKAVTGADYEGAKSVPGIKGSFLVEWPGRGRRPGGPGFRVQSSVGRGRGSIRKALSSLDLELYVQGPLSNFLHRLLDGVVHAPFQPGNGERSWCLHEKMTVVVGDAFCLLQPRIKSRTGQLKLQLT